MVLSDNTCIVGDPHYDPEGMICDNDGTPEEMYCSYGVGATACARCEPTVINGKDCPAANVVLSDNTCIVGDPHYDPEGMICDNDGTPEEMYCSYGVGPTACARCDA